MHVDPNNPIVKLCALGIEHEMLQEHQRASACYQKAWAEANNPIEKFIAAHYLARQQTDIDQKRHWNQTALDHALSDPSDSAKLSLPSLYLNLAKDYEDLCDLHEAKKLYVLAEAHCDALNNDGYGQLIRGGIRAGLQRTS